MTTSRSDLGARIAALESELAEAKAVAAGLVCAKESAHEAKRIAEAHELSAAAEADELRADHVMLMRVSGALCDAGDVVVEPYDEAVRELVRQRDDLREKASDLKRVAATLEAERDELRAQVKRWEDKEISRATCCWENEKAVERLTAELAEAERAKNEAIVDAAAQASNANAYAALLTEGADKALMARVEDLEGKLAVAVVALERLSNAWDASSPTREFARAALAKLKEPT
jgi:chromosome segregation ATPase